MSKFLHNLLAYCTIAMLMCGSFVACSDDETTPEPEIPPVEPSLTIQGISENGEVANAATSWNSASIKVSTEAIVEYAWVLQTAEEKVPAEAIIFKNGTVVNPEGATSTIELTDLSRLTDYVLCIAAKVEAQEEATKATEYYGEVITVKFSTPDYSDEITIVKVNQDGGTIHLKFPAEVAERGNVLKWGISNIALYNTNKANSWNPQCDARILTLNDDVYPAARFVNDTTLVIEDAARYVRDENGEIIYDEGSGEPTYYWDFIAPGEPLVLLVAEFGWGESDWGWGEGWYQMQFDEMGWQEAYGTAQWEGTELPNEDDYWTEGAYHKKIEFTTLPPAEYDGTVEVTTEDLAPNGGIISVAHDDKTVCYCLGVMDHATYTQVVDMYLGGNEDLMQWFSTSYYGMYAGFMTWYTSEIEEYYGGVLQIPMSEFFYELQPGGTYHVIVTCMDGTPSEDDPDYLEPNPMAQNYQHITFELPDYTLDAPEISVTALPATSAYKVGFNVKCENYQNAPIVEAAYAMNYVREFNMELEYSSYDEIVGWNRGYYGFTEEELQQINSDAGCDVWFDSRENATSRLAVMGWNSEGRPSTFEGEEPSAVADSKSAAVPAATPVESELFTELVGDWTATATVTMQAYGDPDGDGVNGHYNVEKEMKSKVTIGDATYPEALTDEIYTLYEENGVNKEMADAYFAELKTSIDEYNKAVRGQNRLLCAGWDFNANESAYYNELELATPWDLFIHPDYNASYIEPLMYEFGPKWFLQVAEDGSVFVPVNVNRVAPLSAWVNSYSYHLVGADPESELTYPTPAEENMDDVSKWPNLPVEVSDDKQTITIKSFTEDDITYYPNVMYVSSWGGDIYNSRIISEVVLTKGWTEPTEDEEVDVTAIRKAAAAAPVAGAKAIKVAKNSAEINVVAAPKARTAFVPELYKKVTKFYDGKALTMEQINERMTNLVEMRSARK